jgi:hypothetical protein
MTESTLVKVGILIVFTVIISSYIYVRTQEVNAMAWRIGCMDSGLTQAKCYELQTKGN